MGNIRNYNFGKIDFKLSNSDFWDLFLANDFSNTTCNLLTEGDCFVVWYDFNESDIFPYGSDSIYSLVTWSGATNSGYNLNTIGLTGIDNGLLTFAKDPLDLTNESLLETLTGSTLVIPADEKRLVLTRVTGTTDNLTYPMELILDDIVGDYMQFNGGFYQGYYKIDGTSYEVLPPRVEHAWAAEFWLRSENLINSGKTLNFVNPDNKGIFFYMGTRAENKFWNEWAGADTGCTSGCTTTDCVSGETVSDWCTIPKENQVTLVGDNGVGIPLDPPRVDIDLITNGFLVYGRGYDYSPAKLTGETGTLIIAHEENNPTCGCNKCQGPKDGLGSRTPCTYDGKGIAVARTKEVTTDHTNKFLVFGRAVSHSGSCSTCQGPQDGHGNQTVGSYSGDSISEDHIDYNLDLIDNAIGFRIKDDGSIGYRMLTSTGYCDTVTGKYISGTTIEEAYSEPDMVELDKWTYVVVRFVTDYKPECELKKTKQRDGRLMFYVNGLLKASFVVGEIMARRLDEYKDKQVGVPFNFSLGGGSQGLLESQTFGGLDTSDRGLPIQENFGGTFIGSISQFKFNVCDLTLCNIRNNLAEDIIRYYPLTTDFLLQENGYYLLQEDGYYIKL